MGEVLAWVLGGLLGAVFPAPLRSYPALIVFGTVACLLGVGVTLINGEWTEAPELMLVDIGQVILSSLILRFVKRQFIMRSWGRVSGFGKVRIDAFKRL
jgi:hypothetical protein